MLLLRRRQRRRRRRRWLRRLGVNGATRVAPVFSREGTSGQKKIVVLPLTFICEREHDFQHAG